MHDENVVHVELAISPQGFRRRGLEIKPCIEALANAFRETLDNFGMTGGIIAGCRRDLPPDEAMEMLNELRACGDDILAVGLHGAEWQNEPRLGTALGRLLPAPGGQTNDTLRRSVASDPSSDECERLPPFRPFSRAAPNSPRGWFSAASVWSGWWCPSCGVAPCGGSSTV